MVVALIVCWPTWQMPLAPPYDTSCLGSACWVDLAKPPDHPLGQRDVWGCEVHAGVHSWLCPVGWGQEIPPPQPGPDLGRFPSLPILPPPHPSLLTCWPPSFCQVLGSDALGGSGLRTAFWGCRQWKGAAFHSLGHLTGPTPLLCV